MRFLFVGERPSHQAVKIGATWQNGKLAGKTLRSALLALHIEPSEQTYINLWTQPDRCTQDATDQAFAIERITALADTHIIVGMGALVSRELTRAGITHLQLIHPAARGAIRKTERYQAHVKSVLFASATR